jgi:hypothetical protein
MHHSTTGNEHRVRCELYGKWIAAVLVHRIHTWANQARWLAAGQEISLEKLYKRLQERAFQLAQQLIISFSQGRAHLIRELEPLLNLPESPLLCMGMNGSPEQGGGIEAQVVGFKEAPPFGRGASLRHCTKQSQRSQTTTLAMLEARVDPKLSPSKGPS